MIDRKALENFLRLNGLQSDADESSVRTLLKNAKWTNDDIESACSVLKCTHEELQKLNSMPGSQRIFDSDHTLSSDAINSLLGMDLEIGKEALEHKKMLEDIYRSQLLSIAVLSFFCAFLFLMIGMWYFHVGFFTEDIVRLR